MAMQTELQVICNSLGYSEDGEYIKDPDCLESIREILRSLRREDDSCDIRRQLGAAGILPRDLIPLAVRFKQDSSLFEHVIRLMVNLTQPARLCFKNEVPGDKTNRKHYMELESCLQRYKEAFANDAFFVVIADRLKQLLQLEWDSREDQDKMLLERLLILIRNILYIPRTQSDSLRTDDDANSHDRILWSIHQSGMEDLLLFLSSSDEERQYAIHCLEIISLMLKEQSPEQLAVSGSGRGRSQMETDKDKEELARLSQREKQKKKAEAYKWSGRRFNGTYVMQNRLSITNEKLIYHKPLAAVRSFTSDAEKRSKKKPKNRQPINAGDITRKSTLNIRVFLKEFCVQFLESCYNSLMKAVKAALSQDRAQEHDETYYLWALRFFMEFSRLYSFNIEVISETMNIPTFHYVQVNLTNYQDMMGADKKDAILWGRRLHLALRAYRELLYTLQDMEMSRSEQIRDSAKILKNNVFYAMEYRDILPLLLRKFDNCRLSKLFLQDLVDTVHIFLKMMKIWSSGGRKVLVEKKKRKQTKRKKKAPNHQVEMEFLVENLDDMWEEVAEDLSDLFGGEKEAEDSDSPFDAASDVPINEQQQDCVQKIHRCLRSRLGPEAVGLFRAARAVWPDEERFGASDLSEDEEFLALRELFFTYSPVPLPSPDAEEDYGEDQDEMVEEEEMAPVICSEQEFDFSDFLAQFTHPRIIKSYVTLLSDYSKQSSRVNHSIVKLLHRVSVDLKMSPVLFQMSLLRIFHKIFNDPTCNLGEYQELKKFAKFIVQQFFIEVSKNPKLYVEIFFWKTPKECQEISNGYGTYKSKASSVKQLWSEEEDMELKQLYEEWKEGQQEQTGTEKDVAEVILEKLIDQTRTRKQVINQLVRVGCVESPAELKKKKAPRVPRTWNEDEEARLRELYEKHKSSNDVMSAILYELPLKRSKRNVTQKLLELGLVSDKKELHKKRKRKAGKPTTGAAGRRSSRESGERESEQEEEEEANLRSIFDQESSSSSDSENSEQAPRSGRSTPAEASSNPPPRAEELLRTLRTEGSDGSIEWLVDALTSLADTREDSDAESDNEDGEGTPLVPQTEAQEGMAADDTFQGLLRALGLTRPLRRQGGFWRIPKQARPTDLRRVAEALASSATEDSGLRVEDLLAVRQAATKPSGKENLHSNKANRKRPTISASGQQQKKRKKKLVPPTVQSSDDDEDRLVIDERPDIADMSDSGVSQPAPSSSRSSAVTGTRISRVRIASDSSSNSGPEDGGQRKAVAANCQEDAFPATLMTLQYSESDSEADDKITLGRAVVRNRKGIVSSSDSE